MHGDYQLFVVVCDAKLCETPYCVWPIHSVRTSTHSLAGRYARFWRSYIIRQLLFYNDVKRTQNNDMIIISTNKNKKTHTLTRTPEEPKSSMDGESPPQGLIRIKLEAVTLNFSCNCYFHCLSDPEHPSVHVHGGQERCWVLAFLRIIKSEAAQKKKKKEDIFWMLSVQANWKFP